MPAQTRIQAPTDSLVSADEMRTHLGLSMAADPPTALDLRITAQLEAFIKAATGFLEDHCERAFLTQKWRISIDTFPYSWNSAYPNGIEIPRPPLQTLDSLIYLDQNGTSQTLDSSGYRIVLDSEPALLFPPLNSWWPVSYFYGPNLVTFDITCGWIDPTDVRIPDAIKLAVKLMVGHYFENREAVSAGNVPLQTIPLGVEQLLAPYRMTRFVG